MRCRFPWNCSTYVSDSYSFFDTFSLLEGDSCYYFCGVACDVLQFFILVTPIHTRERIVSSPSYALVSTRAEAAQDRAIEDDVMNAISNSFNDTSFNDTLDHAEAATAAGGSSAALAAHPEVCA